MSVVLIVNSGSSSFKYQLLDVEAARSLASGLVERIGEPQGLAAHTVTVDDQEETFVEELAIPDHAAGFTAMLDAFVAHGPSLERNEPLAVGHRVVHGGARYFAPTPITPEVEQGIDDLSVLAPLHNPGALQGVRAAKEAFPALPHVAVFDTAFHQTLPPEAYTYAIDKELAAAHRVRRYGFHGTSHKYVSEAAAAFLDRPVEELRQIVFHLGNGASVTAIDGGCSVETSMGMTPLEGLVMGTRSGDIDPAVLLQLARRAGLSVADLDALLNKRSGLLGLAGASDMRDVQRRAAEGDADAELALGVYIHRLRAYAGAYLAQLGGVDVISFTAGVGENNALVRRETLATLGFAGIEIDPERNESGARGTRIISTDSSRATVLVVPTNEELEIGRQTLQVALRS